MFDGNQIETTPLRAAFEPSHRFLAGRDLPPGTLGWHVDCAANPMDLLYDAQANRGEWRTQAEQEARQILDACHARQAPRTPTGREVEKPLAFGS